MSIEFQDESLDHSVGHGSEHEAYMVQEGLSYSFIYGFHICGHAVLLSVFHVLAVRSLIRYQMGNSFRVRVNNRNRAVFFSYTRCHGYLNSSSAVRVYKLTRIAHSFELLARSLVILISSYLRVDFETAIDIPTLDISRYHMTLSRSTSGRQEAVFIVAAGR